MITTITRISLPESITLEAAKNSFMEVAPVFQNIEGLIRKQFLMADDGNQVGGVYLWFNRESAINFNENILKDMIKSKFGVEPQIEYFETPVVVDNEAQEIRT